MMLTDKKLIILLWTVIGVLVLGFIAGGILVIGRAGSLDQATINIKGDNQSLKRQVEQLRAERNANPTPVPTALPDSMTPAPVARPTATPKPSGSNL